MITDFFELSEKDRSEWNELKRKFNLDNFEWVSEDFEDSVFAGDNDKKKKYRRVLDLPLFSTDAGGKISYFPPFLQLKVVLEAMFPLRTVYNQTLKIINSPPNSLAQQYHYDYDIQTICHDCFHSADDTTTAICSCIPDPCDFSDGYQSFSFMLAMEDGTKLDFMEELAEQEDFDLTSAWGDINLVLKAGDLCIWTGGTLHRGTGYETENSRIFGYLSSDLWIPNTNEVYFVDVNSRRN